MNVTDSSAPTHLLVGCSFCQHANLPAAKFCSGCGKNLFEPCFRCGVSVRLDQKFCNGCGTDLAGDLAQRRERCQQQLAAAMEHVTSHQYRDAIDALQRLIDQSDPRLSDVSEQAAAALHQVHELSGQAKRHADQSIQRAHQAMRNGDHEGIVDALAAVPVTLLSKTDAELLARSQSFLDQSRSLKSALQAAIDSKAWDAAAAAIEPLLELYPGHVKYTQLAAQVADKLLRSAQRRMQRQDYSGAMKQLVAVPADLRDDRYLQTFNQCGTLTWLSTQFDGEPFATPTLGRLAVRFVKEAPGSGLAARWLDELTTKSKRPPASTRDAFPELQAKRTTWMGGDAGMLSTFQSIDGSACPQIRDHAVRCGVAVGLALQGLGVTRVTTHLGARKGLLSSLTGRSKTLCWGIDVGSSGIRAVLVRKEKSDPRPVLLQVHCEDFPQPTNRAGGDQPEPLMIKAALQRLLDRIKIGDAMVLANFASSHVVTRFLRLPPVKDKLVAKLVETEASQQIPIPLGELDLVTWTAKLADDLSLGRPTLIAAAKKSLVQSRIDVLAAAGLKVDGLQSDAIALMNLAAFEYADVLAGSPTVVAGRTKTPAVAIVDAGGSSTGLIVVSAETCWYWTIDSGGEDVTSVIARITRSTKDVAEKLKRNPAQLPLPRDQYEPAETKYAELRGRLQKIAGEMLRVNDRFDVRQTWCTGGACLAHGWLRHVLLPEVQAGSAAQSHLSGSPHF